jgi:hypothetical protein
VSLLSSRKSQTVFHPAERVRLLQQFVQGEPAFSQLGHEAAEGCETSHEPLNVLDVHDLIHFDDSRNLVRVCFNVTLGDDVPQELALGTPKVHFFGFNFMVNRRRLLKVSSSSEMRLPLFQDFTKMSST